MTNNKHYLTKLFVLSGILICSTNANSKSDSHSDEHQLKAPSERPQLNIEAHSEPFELGHDEPEGLVSLTKMKINTANIIVKRIVEAPLPSEINAPGEVVTNAYLSSKVTPRINAQVVKRHKRLGDNVKKGDLLVTLSSVDMAQAQGDLLVTHREWQRVKKLGRKVISGRRFSEAQVKFQQTYAKVIAFGMTRPQVESLIKQNDVTQMTGTFGLLAVQKGTIISDDFVIGEIVESGRVLFEITDENTLWVEAQLSPDDAENVQIGARAYISIGNRRMEGTVVQVFHKLNEKTRTFPIRIEFQNKDDRLHPGQFVETKVLSQQKIPVLFVPQEAVLRSPDGDWVVFVEVESGQYQAKEIELERIVNQKAVIKGLKTGSRVVTKGAFFIQSELAKSGFDVHQH